MSAWSHLPNAKYIEWVFDSLENSSMLWNAKKDRAHYAACDIADVLLKESGRYEIWKKARFAAHRYAGYSGATGWSAALTVLVACDDCAQMFESDLSEVKLLATLGDVKAILLLPACIAFAKEKNLA